MDILRKAFADIASGFTHAVILGKSAHVRHLSYVHQIDQDSMRDIYFNEAKSQKLSTNDERLAILRKEGRWTDQLEKDIVNCRRMIEGLIEGKKKHMSMPSMVQGLSKQLKAEEKSLADKLAAKDQLLGLTCESYADRQMNDYYIYSNLFQDSELTVPLFEQDEFDYLSEPDMKLLIDDYNEAIAGCSDHSIKRLAMQGFFQNYFGLVGDQLGQFFGKPICYLTFFQVRLLGYGCHFRNIYQSGDTARFPKNVLEDPDLLMDYAAATKQGRQDLERQGAYDEGAIMVGMKKEDAEILGIKSQTNVIREMAKNGGNVIDWAMKRG